jgi:hypothetical protein
MSADKIPSIRERMRRQEILTRELGGSSGETNTHASMLVAGKRAAGRTQLRLSSRGKPGIRDAGQQIDRRLERPSRSGLPGFASLIRKVIAY